MYVVWFRESSVGDVGLSNLWSPLWLLLAVTVYSHDTYLKTVIKSEEHSYTDLIKRKVLLNTGNK